MSPGRRRVRPEVVVTFTDERLADGTVHRRYDDGRVEWRTAAGPDRAEWRDASGATGFDERLGRGVVKRTLSSGEVSWGRDQGYGRTAWEGGRRVTLDVTRLGGRAGALLAAAAGAVLLGGVRPPPDALGAAEEEALREQRAQARETSREIGVSSPLDDILGADDDGGDGDFG